jgi:hypothetical protein
MCQRSLNSFVINRETKQAHQLHCKAYHCKECGPIKASKLRKALTNYLSQWKIIGFWTITLKQVDVWNTETHQKHLRECWRRFLNSIRRNVSLSPEQRKMVFIKVVEEHKNGFIHYHLATNVFIPYQIVNNIWAHVIEQVTGISGKNGNIHCKSIMNPKQVAAYITKYITKMSLKLAIRLRRYSKSNGLVLFPAKVTPGDWIYCTYRGQSIEEAILEFDLRQDILVSNKHNFPKLATELIASIINTHTEDSWTEYPIKNNSSAWQYINNPLYDPNENPREVIYL